MIASVLHCSSQTLSRRNAFDALTERAIRETTLSSSIQASGVRLNTHPRLYRAVAPHVAAVLSAESADSGTGLSRCVGSTSSAKLCAEGYTSPVCAICVRGYAKLGSGIDPYQMSSIGSECDGLGRVSPPGFSSSRRTDSFGDLLRKE